MRAETAKFQRFQELHRGGQLLVLPNAWDAGSARLLSTLGFPALASTSSGVAWALGVPDGQHLGRDQMLEAIRRMVAVTPLPLTADMEAGYGLDAQYVAETVRLVIEAGAVGVNLEDGTADRENPLASLDDQVARLRAAREAADAAGVDLYINARTDVYLRRVGNERDRLEHTLERAQAYLEAGAAGIFVPGTADLDTISELAARIAAPLNVLLTEGTPSVSVLSDAGVRRLSTGGRLAQAALGLLSKAAAELASGAGYARIFEYALPFAELQSMYTAAVEPGVDNKR
ncbi:MAG: isocitrate lyase/phosphoenolpyruvate mutase family protein [Candidatus Dormibacteraeota bacterium]|nr:isocitrate lyase/phosphoenolpyruvate mutase family protein [Candidatus Dormibacteraeota bacterium]